MHGLINWADFESTQTKVNGPVDLAHRMRIGKINTSEPDQAICMCADVLSYEFVGDLPSTGCGTESQDDRAMRALHGGPVLS